jgi:4-hydroxybenzoate polyprenyltransferase
VFRYIAKYNIHLGLAAAISGFSYSILLNEYLDFKKVALLFLIQFLSVIAAYNYFRKRTKITWQLPLAIVAIVSFFFGFYFQLLLFSIGLISFLYQLPIKNKMGFRFYPFLKPFIIGLCWAILIILLTAETAIFDGTLTDIAVMLMVLKFLEISALCIANDLLHIPKDKVHGVKTFPIAYGINVSKISVIILSSFQILIPVFMVIKMNKNLAGMQLNSAFLLISMMVSYFLILMSVFLIHLKKIRGVEYLLDIIIGVEAFVFIVLHYAQFNF